MLHDERALREFEKLGLAAPTTLAHGLTPDEIRERLVPANPTNWKLQGNQLSCDTDHGPLVQTIDPSYILRGIDAEGLPILEKIAL